MSQAVKHKWLALALLCTVQFMVILDIAIVNVALPSIQVDLGFSQENLQWVISAYALVFGGFLLLGGRLADLLGRRRVFMAGLVVFTIGSLLCGLSWSEGSLIAARALQGLGAATISPAALSILTTTFREGRERNIALGAWGAVGGVGAAAGVLMGGVLVDLLSWEWIFFVNIPVGVAALILVPILLVESRDERESSFDVLGAVLVTAGLSILVLGITKGQDWGWASGRTLAVFALSAVLLAGFILQESRTKHPLMPFSIFRLQTLTAANIVMFIMGTALFSMFLMLTLYMQQVLHFSPLKTGIGYLAVAGTAIIWANVAAQIGQQVRRQADARHRHVRDDGRPGVVHPGLGRRLLLEEPLPGLPRDRVRNALRVRLAHDRSAGGDATARGRAGFRPDQHLAADRRRGGDRDPLHRRDIDDDGLREVGHGRARGAHERIPERVLGRRSDHPRRRDRVARPRSPARLRARTGGGGLARSSLGPGTLLRLLEEAKERDEVDGSRTAPALRLLPRSRLRRQRREDRASARAPCDGPRAPSP